MLPMFEDDWLDTELAEILVSTPPGVRDPVQVQPPTRPSDGYVQSTTKQDPSGFNNEAIEEAIVGLTQSEPLELSLAFELLQSFRSNDPRALGRLPVRSTASPLTPSACMSYVVCKRLCDASSTVSAELAKGEDSIPVSFQSILNSDVWWSASEAYPGEGVASRPMSRSTRCNPRAGRCSDTSSSEGDLGSDPGSSGGQKQATHSHGYRGRMYTLVARAPGAPNFESRNKRQRINKADTSSRSTTRYVALGDVSIVHAWRASEEEQLVQARKVSSCGSTSSAPTKPAFVNMLPPLKREADSALSRITGDDELLTCLTPRESFEERGPLERPALEVPDSRPTHTTADARRAAAAFERRPRCFGPLAGDGLRGETGRQIVSVVLVGRNSSTQRDTGIARQASARSWRRPCRWLYLRSTCERAACSRLCRVVFVA